MKKEPRLIYHVKRNESNQNEIMYADKCNRIRIQKSRFGQRVSIKGITKYAAAQRIITLFRDNERELRNCMSELLDPILTGSAK